MAVKPVTIVEVTEEKSRVDDDRCVDFEWSLGNVINAFIM